MADNGAYKNNTILNLGGIEKYLSFLYFSAKYYYILERISFHNLSFPVFLTDE